jgi:hypothetical protein
MTAFGCHFRVNDGKNWGNFSIFICIDFNRDILFYLDLREAMEFAYRPAAD